MDDRTSIKRVKPLTLSQIPEKDDSIFATTGAEGTIRGNSNGVDISRVASKGVSQLAVGQVPHLDGSVPGSGNDGWLKGAGAESHTADPIGVSVVVLNGVLALTEGVPQLDGAVAGGGHDLTVVNGESDGEDVLGVTDEAAGGGAGSKVPEAELAVP